MASATNSLDDHKQEYFWFRNQIDFCFLPEEFILLIEQTFDEGEREEREKKKQLCHRGTKIHALCI